MDERFAEICGFRSGTKQDLARFQIDLIGAALEETDIHQIHDRAGHVREKGVSQSLDVFNHRMKAAAERHARNGRSVDQMKAGSTIHFFNIQDIPDRNDAVSAS